MTKKLRQVQLKHPIEIGAVEKSVLDTNHRAIERIDKLDLVVVHVSNLDTPLEIPYHNVASILEKKEGGQQ